MVHIKFILITGHKLAKPVSKNTFDHAQTRTGSGKADIFQHTKIT